MGSTIRSFANIVREGVATAILRCCGRRRGSSSSSGELMKDEERSLQRREGSEKKQDAKKNDGGGGGGGGEDRRGSRGRGSRDGGSSRSGGGGRGRDAGGSSRSKSSAPVTQIVDSRADQADTRRAETASLLRGPEENVGEFSMVERETDILRPYQKPPPPQNRSRASRVPRAINAVDPSASLDVFRELLKHDVDDISLGRRQPTKPIPRPSKPAQGAASRKGTSRSNAASSPVDDTNSTQTPVHAEVEDHQLQTGSSPSSKDSAPLGDSLAETSPASDGDGPVPKSSSSGIEKGEKSTALDGDSPVPKSSSSVTEKGETKSPAPAAQKSTALDGDGSVPSTHTSPSEADTGDKSHASDSDGTATVPASSSETGIGDGTEINSSGGTPMGEKSPVREELAKVLTTTPKQREPQGKPKILRPKPRTQDSLKTSGLERTPENSNDTTPACPQNNDISVEESSKVRHIPKKRGSEGKPKLLPKPRSQGSSKKTQSSLRGSSECSGDACLQRKDFPEGYSSVGQSSTEGEGCHEAGMVRVSPDEGEGEGKVKGGTSVSSDQIAKGDEKSDVSDVIATEDNHASNLTEGGAKTSILTEDVSTSLGIEMCSVKDTTAPEKGSFPNTTATEKGNATQEGHTKHTTTTEQDNAESSATTEKGSTERPFATDEGTAKSSTSTEESTAKNSTFTEEGDAKHSAATEECVIIIQDEQNISNHHSEDQERCSDSPKQNDEGEDEDDQVLYYTTHL